MYKLRLLDQWNQNMRMFRQTTIVITIFTKFWYTVGGRALKVFCLVDCEVGGWRDTSDCSATCSGGRKTRARDVVQQPQFGGAACPALEETIDCNIGGCKGSLLPSFQISSCRWPCSLISICRPHHVSIRYSSMYHMLPTVINICLHIWIFVYISLCICVMVSGKLHRFEHVFHTCYRN